MEKMKSLCGQKATFSGEIHIFKEMSQGDNGPHTDYWCDKRSAN